MSYKTNSKVSLLSWCKDVAIWRDRLITPLSFICPQLENRRVSSLRSYLYFVIVAPKISTLLSVICKHLENMHRNRPIESDTLQMKEINESDWLDVLQRLNLIHKLLGLLFCSSCQSNKI